MESKTLTVTCPLCGAPAGSQCTYVESGKDRGAPHAARRGVLSDVARAEARRVLNGERAAERRARAAEQSAWHAEWRLKHRSEVVVLVVAGEGAPEAA